MFACLHGVGVRLHQRFKTTGTSQTASTSTANRFGYIGIVHHPSGPSSYAPTKIHPKTSGSVGPDDLASDTPLPLDKI